MKQSPLPVSEAGRVRVVTWVRPDVAEKLDAAASRAKFSSSGYIAAALTRHCLAIDLFAGGMDGHEIARALRMTYADVMVMLGRQIDDAAKGRREK